MPVLIAAAVALFLSRALNSLSLGSDTATALGSKVARTQFIGLLVITVLCGSATAIVGPIAFIGLMMPHMARWLVGADHRWSLPVTLLATPSLLLIADIIGRPDCPRRTARFSGQRIYRRAGAYLSGTPETARGWRIMHLSRRLIVSSLLLVVSCLAVGLWSLRSGVVTLETQQIIAALLGDAPRSITLVVTEWRLPRVLMALLIGAALGVSGAIFQSLMRKPAGQPGCDGFQYRCLERCAGGNGAVRTASHRYRACGHGWRDPDVSGGPGRSPGAMVSTPFG
ncbi:iron-enterobactin transporter membrane protein [Citrobacter freundii]|nr:iron-enterobactin transporter membrane protein [Citrobacter freundii]